MPQKNFGGKDSNFRILAYIKQSMQRHYIYLSKQKSNYQIHNLFLEELPTKEHSDSTESIIVIREFVQHQSPINRKIILYRYLGYSNAEIGNRSVSYTHLDVYKRQEQSRNGTDAFV